MRLAVLVFSLAFWTVSLAATYHVDPVSGHDEQDGTTPARAWASLARASEQVFEPGDELRLRAGTSAVGQLAPQGSGTAEAPIVLSRYGEGADPRLEGRGEVLDTLLLHDVEYWEVADLEITNEGAEREAWRTGVRVVAEHLAPMRHIHLRRLHVHDVNGDLRKSHEGCGIYFESRGRETPSYFEDLRIEDCRVVRTDRNGICQRNGSGPHSTGVVIRGNLLEDIGGDGIKVWGSEAPLVEHNVVRGGRMRCEDHAAGIWPFDCTDALIQFNEVSGMRGTLDGQGFDADYACRGTVIQYNYSHDNEGGFLLVCGPGGSVNDGTVVRFNVSQNDGGEGARVFHFGGASTNTRVEHNTIYLGPDQDLPLMLFTEWDGGRAENVHFSGNLFYVDGQARYDWGEATGLVFENNLFFGRHEGLPASVAVTDEPPALADPGAAAAGFESLRAYQPLAAGVLPPGQRSPGFDERDILGRPLPDGPAVVGALQPE